MSEMSAEEIQTLTPMLRQFYELKSKAEGAILFFRMGDFYEIFGDDAELAAPLLDLMMTSRERGDKNRIPFCGVPHHSAKAYWIRLLKLGHSVAIADQMEDPATTKGLVRRDIVQIMTPGCLDEPEALEADAPNYLVAVYEEPKKRQWSLLLMDSSTGELKLGTLEREELASWIQIYQPKEILARRFMHDELRELLRHSPAKISLTVLPEAILRDGEEQLALLKSQFAVASLSALPCGDVAGGQALLTASLQYLKSLKAGLGQFLTVKPLHEDDRMVLDETVRRDLEIFETARRRDAEGSFFREINHTRTPMGARLLRYDLSRPFVRQEPIQRRQEAVAALLARDESWRADLRNHLKACADLDRLATRVLSGKAQAGDLHNIRVSLGLSLALKTFLEQAELKAPFMREVAHGLGLGAEAHGLLQAALQEQPGALGTLEVFQEGYDAEFDQLRALSRDGSAQIDAYEQQLRSETGISSLKIREHKSYGLLIEVTKPNLAKVPSHFVRRQTMVNNERFITVQLEELDATLSSASEKALAKELALFQALLLELVPRQAELRQVASELANLDLIQSFASKAAQDGYNAPELSEDGQVQLIAARHPVVERWVGRHAFMPNDLTLDRQHAQLLITGPNMAGKSTVMRQTALAAILHQIGSSVPAQKARLPIFDRIFTRVGAADDLSRGQSTFMVEMAEAATILRQASSRSLVILDEVGRGTSTEDGLAIASAILEYIAKSVRCYTLFATHYHELVAFAENLPSVKDAQVEVLEEDRGIRFTHRLIPGASGSSFGIEVARLAGIPEAVIEAAKLHMTTRPESQSARPVEASRKKPKFEQKPPMEFSFDEENPGLIARPSPSVQSILERLERVNVLKTTPLQALAILDELKTKLEQENREPSELFSEIQRLC